MSQINKTLVFVAVAAVVVLAVYVTRPESYKADAASAVGDKLVAEFDPMKAADLEILDYDKFTGEVIPFEVKQVEGKGKTVWSIPSHSNYPADAKDQVAQAATSLLGLQILGTVGENKEDQNDHELYGVVEPNPKRVKYGSQGVGMRVTLRDKKGKDLVSLIVGKEVPNHKEQRYVRLAGKPTVYIVAMKTDALSTRFDRWIEKSLLQISTWDLSKLWIRDHAVEATMDGMSVAQHGEIVLQYNDQGKPQWELLDNLVLGPNQKLESVKLAPDQELNTAKLDEMKNALPELQIVDVVRKPDVFSADLKSKGDKTKLSKFNQILEEYGFYWGNIGEGADLYSNNGEFRCLMKDGVEYVLRFGNVALESSMAGTKQEESKDAKEGQEKKEEKKGAGVNRYLFVMAQFNPAGIPKPEIKPLPGDKPAEGSTPPAKDAKPAENPPAPETKPPAEEAKPAPATVPGPTETPKPADENKPASEEEKKPVEAKPTSYAEQNPAEDKPADAKPAETAPAETKPAETKPAETKPVETKPAPDKPIEEKPADAQKAPDKAAEEKPADTQETPAANEKPAQTAPPAADHPEDNPIALPTDPKQLEAQREQVEKENKRNQEAYEEKVKAGKKRVEELNERFADWFYIISDETYQKIHLTRENLIIKKTEKKEEKPADLPPGGVTLPPGMPAPGGQ